MSVFSGSANLNSLITNGLTSNSQLVATPTSNQILLGTTKTTTLNAIAPASNITLSILDSIQTTANILTNSFNSGLNFNSTRPGNTAATVAQYEIRGNSSAAATYYDGFLRLSAGANSLQSYIDLSGYSTVTDMNQNIVFGVGSTEQMRLTSTNVVHQNYITFVQNATPNTTIPTTRIAMYDNAIKLRGYSDNNHYIQWRATEWDGSSQNFSSDGLYLTGYKTVHLSTNGGNTPGTNYNGTAGRTDTNGGIRIDANNNVGFNNYAPSYSVDISGQARAASGIILGSTVLTTSIAGNIMYNSAFKGYNGTSWVTFINDTDAQTIYGSKTFEGAVSAPAGLTNTPVGIYTPAYGYFTYYAGNIQNYNITNTISSLTSQYQVLNSSSSIIITYGASAGILGVLYIFQNIGSASGKFIFHEAVLNINGSSSYSTLTLTTGQSAMVVYNGTLWNVITNNGAIS